ncbi:hypothetical protein PPUJ20028_32730 [Pseudomonas putida]|uniref:Uncharacterized protein n=1 Tax=Pseudomonas putida TaxID=303 RepID=A0AA37R8W4_PSEPU|nr:hypothetical protein [Pseudomonas putida]GLO14690.1 hypothetical protein PPUJ20028_32730 [Pseudomonas putida]GLO34943.1 hypothetical protein PPUN14671_17760 [Pseudomonas putida]HDS0963573.1 hypothetical protein [Pseudomonas putida]HDS0988832.1 hypothetical protein [Pseudomonas putida]
MSDAKASADVDYAAANRLQQERNEAIFSCGMNGQNMNVQACFKDSAFKLTTQEGGKLYNIYNILQAGSMENDGLHIDLPKSFEVAARNSHTILVLAVTIKDSDGKTLYC